MQSKNNETIQSKDNEILKFFARHGINKTISFSRYDYHFSEDKEKRNIYQLSLYRTDKERGGSVTVEFGDSIFNTRKYIRYPDLMEIMECLQWYDVGSYKDFLNDYGYNLAERGKISTQETYKACLKQYQDLMNFFTENEMNQILEIIED